MINGAKLHSIIIYKHEIDLKQYTLTFKVRQWIIRKINLMFLIEIQFNYKSKYIVQTIYNKKFPLLKEKVITKMMNHNNQFKTLCVYKLMFSFIFVEMKFDP